MKEQSRRRAVALMSGGLDSNLAVRLIHDMGIEVIGVHFTGPFCMCNRGAGGCIQFAGKLAAELGIRFRTQGLGQEYLDMVVDPKHGRGSGMNPCVDCRILMFRRAKALMEEEGAGFVFTGEVLGQRPMSQLRKKLDIIERESGLEGYLLRPLSAQHLTPTVPEQQGWVDREKLLGIQGRRRREQMDLAERLAIGDYPCPAGGCLLTDKPFSAKLRERLKHGTLAMRDIGRLKIGRHFRLPQGAKLVVARDKPECEALERMVGDGEILLTPEEVMGPSALLIGKSPIDGDLRAAADVVAAYCDGGNDVALLARSSSEETHVTGKRSERARYAPWKV